MPTLKYWDDNTKVWKPLSMAPDGEVYVGPDEPPEQYDLWTDTSEDVSPSWGYVPTGFMGPYGGNVAPAGWHLCNGSPHGSAALAAILGSPNAPDLRDQFVLAAGNTYPAKATGGESSHVLTVAEMPSHTHATKRGAGGTEYPVHSTTEVSGSWTPFNTDPRGDGNAHNNMPPYYALTYIIKL